MIATPAHLGGHQHMSWVDEPVLDHLIARYQIKSMLDVGCGLGAMVDLARSKGIDAMGVDGDPQIDHYYVLRHDYTRGPFLIGHITDHVDLIWCVEFVEHVEAIYQENYLATFASGHVLYLTAAYPGQGGYHHVNEQPMEYWIDLLTAHGWKLDEDATDWVHEHGAIPFSRMTGMVFVRG
jgi:SAM-dependent methyltransferase